MYLPSKAVPTDQALVTVGAQILLQLEQPGTVSAIWERVNRWRASMSMPSALPFWWFALALDALYALGTVELHDGQLMKLREGQQVGARGAL